MATVKYPAELTASALLRRLKGEIAPDQWRSLESGGEGLVISRHNTETLLSMRGAVISEDFPIDSASVEALEALLEEYLDRYMSDKPEGHKWIIISSLYLCFIARKPMHPIDIVGIRTAQEGGKTVYYCPAKTSGKGDICSFCVCRFA
ncbi:MAG: DUF2115 family protein [Oscillospiraceae bacterium]|nr:DUF2115 family protein [Oscillospiraceae bacterium]